jgi:ferredoxin-type protein NapG
MHRNERTGKHTFMLPIEIDNACTACGLSEIACVTEKPAIFVLPNEVSKGVAGDHYVKGWDKKDQNRVQDAKEIETTTELSNQSSSDYLNSGDLY